MTRDELIEQAAEMLYRWKKGVLPWNIWSNEPEWHKDEFREIVRLLQPPFVAFVAEWIDANEEPDNPSIELSARWREEMGAE